MFLPKAAATASAAVEKMELGTTNRELRKAKAVVNGTTAAAASGSLLRRRYRHQQQKHNLVLHQQGSDLQWKQPRT